MDEKRLMGKFDRLNRKMRRHFDSFFPEPTLSSVQALTLHYIIVESENRDVYPKDIEEFLEIKGSSVNNLINNLERNGYLRRESVSHDGRYKKLVLTEQTRTMQADITERVMAYMKGMFAGISDQDLQVFDAVISQMTKNAR